MVMSLSKLVTIKVAASALKVNSVLLGNPCDYLAHVLVLLDESSDEVFLFLLHVSCHVH